MDWLNSLVGAGQSNRQSQIQLPRVKDDEGHWDAARLQAPQRVKPLCGFLRA